MSYNSLLKKRRRRLHAAIAAYLKDRNPHLAVVEPELLAHHFTEADLPQPAIAYRLMAGERAMQRSAMAEAAAELGPGLKLLLRIDSQPHRHSLHLTPPMATAAQRRRPRQTTQG